MLCSSQLQSLQVLQEAPALTLGHIALVPVHGEVAQEVLDPGGSDGEQKAQELPPALPGDEPRAGGGLGWGAESAPDGADGEHQSNPDRCFLKELQLQRDVHQHMGELPGVKNLQGMP